MTAVDRLNNIQDRLTDTDERAAMQKAINLMNRRSTMVCLPCQIGTTIYSIVTGQKVYQYKVDSFSVTADGVNVICEDMLFRQKDFGTHFFYDEKMAEEALQKKREKGLRRAV